jgi:hypothetical protein
MMVVASDGIPAAATLTATTAAVRVGDRVGPEPWRRSRSLTSAIAWLLCIVGVFPTGLDVDLWGHLRFGVDFLKRGALTATDPYSFTQDVPWLNHEWLSEALMAAAYLAGGPVGLVLLKCVVMATALLTAWQVFARGRDPLLSVACLLVTVDAALPIMVTVRPHMFSFLAIAVVCRLLIAPTRFGLAVLPAIFAIWANLHGGWVVGAAIVGAWALAAPPEGQVFGRGGRLSIVVVSMLATLLNPYGVHLWTFLAGTVRLTRDITEWQPLWKAPVLVIAPWAMAVGVLIASSRAARRPAWPYLLPAAGLAYGSLRVLRLTPYFVLVTLMFLAPTAQQALDAARQRVRNPRAVPALSFAVLLAVMFAAIAIIGIAFVAARAGYETGCVLPAITATAIPDQDAAASLDGRAGRLAVWFDWGEYAIWRFGPGLRVSMDGRRETVYSARTIDEQAALGRGESAGTAFLERTHPEYVWYPATNALLKDWLDGHGYRLDVETARSFIAVRNDLPHLDRGMPSISRCFPSALPR